jgi:hypothetical protein
MRNSPRPSRTLGSFAPRSAVLGVALLAASAPAYADDLAGSYEVKFEQVSTNCEHPLAYPQHGTIKIEVKSGDVQVDIDRTPLMVGKTKSSKVGEPKKVSAKSPKPGHTPIEGMDGAFSVAGRVTTEGMLALVMVGEYQTAGKPLCTQSWNLSGLKAHPDKADKPDKPKK